MEFINSLIFNAKKGNTRSYLEICQFYGKQIYQLIYQHHPNKKHSSKLSIEVFIHAWENIQNFNIESDFSFWLKEIALSQIQLVKQCDEKELWNDVGFEHDFMSLNRLVFSGLENSFLELPLSEKISFKLYNDLGFDFKKISKFLDLKNSDTAKDLVIYSIRMLALGGGYNVLAELNYKQMKVLLDKLKYREGGFDIISEEDDKSILNEYNELINKLQASFGDVEVSEDLVEIIYDRISRLEEEQRNRESIALSMIEQKKTKTKSEFKSRTKIYIKRLFQTEKWLFVSDPWKRKKFLWGAHLALAGILLVYILFIHNFNEPWLINHAIGNYKINGVISNATSLSENDIISTDVSDTLDLTIPAVADVKIFSTTELQIVKPLNNVHVFKLIKGEIELKSYKVSGNIEETTTNIIIIVQTPFGNLKTESAALKICILENEACLIQLSRGWAEYIFADESVYLAAGYTLNINKIDKYRVPFNVNTSDLIRSTILKQNFPIRGDKVIELLQSADRIDLLTFLHLLKYTDKLSREQIIEYIRKYVPFIDEKVKYKLASLDEGYYQELAMFIRNLLTY